MPLFLHFVGAGCDARTEILAAGLHLEALASCWKETAGLRAVTIAILFVPSPSVQNTSLLEAILWALFHVSPLRQASLQLFFPIWLSFRKTENH